MHTRKTLLTALALAACYDEFGTFEPSGTVADGGRPGDIDNGGAGGKVEGGGGSGADGGSGGDFGCNDVEGYICAEMPGFPNDVDADWQGPLLLKADIGEDCAQFPAFPEQGLRGFVSDNPENECNCGCEVATQPPCTASLALFDDPDCSDDPPPPTAVSTCVLFGPGVALRAVAAPNAGGTCDPTFADPTFTEIDSCKLDSPWACPLNKVCIRPQEPDQISCVYAEGDHACGTPFPIKHLFFEGDAPPEHRCDAGDCDCGSVTGGSCGGQLVLKTDCGPGQLDTVPVNGTCEPVVGSGATYTATATGGGCAATPVFRTPNPTTLCCALAI